MASSSETALPSLASAESPSHHWNHEVFLSFRGLDTRKGITSDLYDRLQTMRGIKTFMDNHELEVGDAISSRLLTAIEESRFAIVILSQHYASSAWCLEELTTIFHCMKDRNRILPLFYQVDPSHVRYRKGNFEVAFTKHKSRQGIEKVKQWRDALEKVSNLSGWDSNNYGSDKELVEDIVQYVWSKVLQVRIETESTTRDFEAFEATKLAMDKVMKALNDDQVAVIGVYGMGGVGKTTMVKHVGAEARSNGLFDKVIMAVVSQTPDLKKIQSQLAEMLALKLEEETEVGRAYLLNERIKRGSKILIILDDIWGRIELSKIGIPSNNELQICNSKILLTTRISNVCQDMDSQAKINLSILSEEDSLSLFVKKARISSHESTEIYNEARRIARNCAGLPVALIAVARALGDKDLDEWKEAAQQLRVFQHADPQDESYVFECIKLSYNYLRSNDAKSCFLLCCLFPEDYDIPIEDLVKYGIGKGLFQDSNTLQEARAIASLVVKSLKASSLLLDTEEKGSVRMHDVVREVALSISLSEDDQQFFVKAGCKLKDWPKINADKDYSAISLMKNDIRKVPQKLVVCSKLQILLLQHNAKLRKIPETFFPSSLRVLDLSRTRIPFLPTSFHLLTNLHSLYLDYCRALADMSFLRKMENLKILSMRECRLRDFPKEIGNLTNLRMLDITKLRVYFNELPCKIISRLSRLEELHMQSNFESWGLMTFDRFNAGFDELIGLSDLNLLEVFLSGAECLPKNVGSNPNWIKFDICIGETFLHNPSNLYSRSLSLNTSMNTLPGWFIKVVTERAEKLQYRRCEKLTNIIVEHDHGRLHGLKYLCIFSRHENLKELMNTTARVSKKPVLENLEKLDLSQVNGLKQLCVGELPPGSLCNLKFLKVEGCPDLGNTLVPSKLLKRLESLEKLTCSKNNGMEYVFGSSSSSLSDCLEPDHMTKLSVMRLYKLVNLIKILNGPAPHAIFHNLKSLGVDNCLNLKSLFTTNVARGLLQLENLWVERCPSLDSLIELSSDEIVKNKKMIFVLPGLKNLLLHDLRQLTGFFNSGSVTIHIECPLLGHIHLANCPQFSTSVSDFHSRNQVQVDDYKHQDLLLKRLWEISTAK